MLRNLFGPKHTLKDALLILETGLRNGQIKLRDELGGESTPVMERVNVQHSVGVYLSVPQVFYADLRWSDRAASAGAH